MKRLFTIVLLGALAFAGEARAQWVEVNGQGGSHVSSLVTVGRSLFAGTNNGIIISTDSGLSWTEAGLEKEEIYSIAAIGTNVFATSISDLFRSTDSGLSWTLADSNLPTKYTWNCPLVANGSNLFMGTSTGVFRSSDLGSSWIAAGLSIAAVRALAIADTNIVAATDSGVYLSTNEGSSWSPNTLSNGSVDALFIAGDTLFAGTYGGYYPARIFISTDWGKHWTEADEGIDWVYDNIDQIYAFGVHDSSVFVGTSNGVFCSTNGGFRWTLRDSGITNSNVNSFMSFGNYFLAANTGIAELPGGVFWSSNNGKSWGSVNTTFPEGFSEVDGLAAIGGNLFAASDYGGILLSSNNGTTWVARNDGLGDQNPISLSSNDSTLLAGCDMDGLFRSSNEGLSWEYVGLDSVPWIIPIQMGQNLYAGSNGNGVFLSTDGGGAWQSIDSGLMGSNGGLTGLSVRCFAVDGMVLFAGTNQGIFCLDTANTWRRRDTGLTTDLVNSLAVLGIYLFAGTGDSHTFVDSGGAVFRSADGGSTWTKVGLDNTVINSLIIAGPVIFAGTTSGLFVSTDSGLTWFANNSGLVDTFISSLAVVGSNVFVGSLSGVCFRRPILQMIENNAVAYGVVEDDAIRSYPNPFSERAEITFTSQTMGYADVSIVNVLGAPVAHLFSGELGAGNHSFAWDAHGVAPGSYWCIVRMGGHVERVGLSRQ